ncbi:MAG: methyl-accepting chemotaxis protein [Anaerolineales bacterium]
MNSEMKLSFFQSMRGKILIAFLVITLIPLGIVGVLSVLQAEKALQNAATNQLEAVMEVKKDWIESQLAESANDVHLLTETADALREEAFDALQSTLAMKKLQLQLYFQERKSDISVMAKSDRVFAALQAFEGAMITGTVGSAEWEAVEVEYGRWLQEFNDNYGYADTYLVNPEGLIVYTAKNEAELGESLISGPLQNSGAAQAFRRGLEGFAFQDFSLYAPADDSPSAFLATPVINENNLLLGVMMVRIEAEMINTIMLERTGLGETGETYLVGPDFRMRSDSYLDPVGHSVATSLAGTVTDNGVDTEASRAALAGKSGVNVLRDYRGIYVLSAYAPVTLVGGIQWAMLAEMDMVEAFIPTFDSADDDYYRRYIANHEMFEDLLLITPDGVVFYSAAQAEDYQTNLLNGPYRDTALGELVAEVMESGKQKMADFAPYPPAGNKPVAFLAAPITYEDRVAMVLAARMPVDEIDRVMQQREGMGETGETVLVGPDMRMRSDSVIDPVDHSVAASFAGTPEENGITSSSVQAGLAGETGVEELVDYRGETVLEAYAPVQVSDDLTWVILAKQDRAEAYQDAATLQTLMLGVGGVTAVTVVIIALVLASTLSRPVVKITQAAQAVANGDLDVEAEVKSRDESGILARAFNQMVSQLREMLSNEQARRQRLQATVEEYVSHMAIVGQGNLAARLDVGGNGHNPNDPLIRLGQNLNDLTANLQQMIQQIREAANNLSSASTEIMAATTQQASGASEQSAAITQTTTTVDEVKAISEQAIVRAQEVADSAQRTVEVSRGGMQAVQETMQSMAQIKERVEGIAENILALSEQTQQIGEITSTVNDIASQSNMLALNASVEAARAGEHGKGFAVVAVEVRNLAEQSKQATAQVRAILTDIQNAINATVMVTEEGTKVVDLGVQLAEEGRGAIEQLAAVINESAQTATQVVAGGQQQASGVEQIAMAMQNINQAMMQSMASTRQAEKAAQDLNELARRLNDTVQEYTL